MNTHTRPVAALACAAALALPTISRPSAGAHAATAHTSAHAAHNEGSEGSEGNNTLHPYHVSYTEATLDRERSVLQVAMRLWPDHLQDALRVFTEDPKFDIDGPSADEHIAAYLGTRFTVRAAAGAPQESPAGNDGIDPGASPVRWVGKEIGVKHAWLYFETPVPSGAATIDVANTALFGVTARQENTIELRVGDRSLSAVSTPLDPWTRLRLDRGPDSIALLAGTLGNRLHALADPPPLDRAGDGPVKLITLRLPEPDTRAPAAAELLASVARAAPLLVIAEPELAGYLRAELDRQQFDHDALELIEAAGNPAEPLSRATEHIARPGAVVAVAIRSPGGSNPANRVANALRSLEPERNLPAAVALTDEPIAGDNRTRLADLRGMPAQAIARWAQAADQRGPVFPVWLVIHARAERANHD